MCHAANSNLNRIKQRADFVPSLTQSRTSSVATVIQYHCHYWREPTAKIQEAAGIHQVPEFSIGNEKAKLHVQ
jgi:hypothetical protein